MIKLRNLLNEVREKSQFYFGALYNKANEPIVVGITKFISETYKLFNQPKFDAFLESKSKIQNVPIKKLNIGQSYIETDKLDNLKDFDYKNYNPVHVYQYKRKLYLHNGHHRTIKMIQNNEKNIKAHVLNVDKLIDNDLELQDDLNFYIKRRSIR